MKSGSRRPELVVLGLAGVVVAVAAVLRDDAVAWPRWAQIVAIGILMVAVVALGAFKDLFLVRLATADTRTRDLDWLVKKVLTGRRRVRTKVRSATWSLTWPLVSLVGLGMLRTSGQSGGTSDVGLPGGALSVLVGLLVVLGMVATASAGWVDPLAERAMSRVYFLLGAAAVAGGGLYLCVTTRERRFVGGTPDASMVGAAAVVVVCSVPIMVAFRSAETVRKARTGGLGAEARFWVAAAVEQERPRRQPGVST